jgi:hypothetical protein
VVDEQVDLGAVVLDVPAEHLGVGGFEHHLLEAELRTRSPLRRSVRQVLTSSVIPSDSIMIM